MGVLRKRNDLERADREFVGRTDEAIDLDIASARGSRLVDTKGRSYIDLTMGWCVGNLGWNHPAILERLREYRGPSYVPPSMRYAPWIELARELGELVPGELTRAFRAVGGTEAVEQALQIARAVTGRKKIIGLADAYHGNSIGVREEIDKKLAPPLDAGAVDRLETLLKRRDIACFIMEPVVINLGVEVPTDAFMRGARELCDRYGTLLVLDEVASGFGRTGRLFATDHYGIAPDIMTLGKAITNGHAPLAATLVTPEVADAIEDLSFYSTFGWHPLAVEAALAVVAEWREHQAEILDNVERRSGEFLSRLLTMPWKQEAEIRMKGLAITVKLDEEYASRIADRCRDRGVIVGDDEDQLLMFPALTIGEDDASAALDILEHAVSA